MIDDRHSSFSAYGSTIRARPPQDPVSGQQPETRARGYLAEAHEGLDAAWTEHKSEVDRFEDFRALDDDSKANWLAYIVARSLEAKPSYRAEHCRSEEHTSELQSPMRISYAGFCLTNKNHNTLKLTEHSKNNNNH